MRSSQSARRERAGAFAATLVLAAALLALAAIGLGASARAAAQPAAAAPADEVALARTYAPVVRLKEQSEPCGPGEPYEPIDINLLMGNDEVALRGPWDTVNLVRVAPTADDLSRGLHDYHLDFPGNALDPGCTYERWSQRLTAGTPPTIYARVVTEAGEPGRLALQYWFFYVFNDFNNTHEGDWEMIQLNFDAATPDEALARRPVEVGYSQHSSAERARWGDPKLQIVGGTHPVVYPAAGSHANFFRSDLFLMRSSAEGVGCDNTTGPSRTIDPVVATVPHSPQQYMRAFPWLGFEGRWGEKQRGFYNGPTGPNLKDQWTHPISWSRESWRDESFAVPGGGLLGTRGTDFFCGSIAAGSNALLRMKARPLPALLVIGALALLLVWALSRTRWGPSSPLRVARRRAWGQLLSASARMYLGHIRVFFGIGLLFLPLGMLVALVQWLIFRVSVLSPLVSEAGERNGFVAALALGLGLVVTLLGLAIVQAAAARAIVEIDAGRPVSALSAYRDVAGRLRPLLLALVVAVAAQVVLNLTVVLIPVAIFVLVRWSLLAVVIGIERAPAWGGLRRSAALTRRHWWRAASIIIGITGAAVLAGPTAGVLALLATGASFNVVNLIAAVVYAAVLPFAAIAATYLYFDLRVRHETAPAPEPLPAELPSSI